MITRRTLLTALPALTGVQSLQRAAETTAADAMPEPRRLPGQLLQVWKPNGDNFSASIPADLFRLGTGRTSGVVIEMDDAFDAVQLLYASAGPTPWLLEGALVAPSASYGGSPVMSVGVTPVDPAGVALDGMVPIAHGHGGADSDATHSAGAAFAEPAQRGAAIITLVTAEAAPEGQPNVVFRAIRGSQLAGFLPATRGMYACDMRGAVARDARVAAIDGTRIRLTHDLAAPIGPGTQVFFAEALLAQQLPMPGSTNPPEQQVRRSDWSQVSSFPRTDGGMRPAMLVAGPGIAAGTRVLAVGPAHVDLDRPTLDTVPNNTRITFLQTAAMTRRAAGGDTLLPLARTFNLRPGQTVSGHAALPAGAHVMEVEQAHVRLSAALERDLPAGTELTFTLTAWTFPGPTAYLARAINGEARGELTTPWDGASDAYPAISPYAPGFPREGVVATLTTGRTEVTFNRPVSIGARQLWFNTPRGGRRLYFVSTSDKPLLLVRLAASGAPLQGLFTGMPEAAMRERRDGMTAVALVTASAPGKDGMSQVAAFGNVESAGTLFGVTPLYGVVATRRRPGLIVMVNGDSHMSGAQTIGTNCEFARRLVARMAAAGWPASLVNTARGGQPATVFLPQLRTWAENLPPSILLAQWWTHNGPYDPATYIPQVMAIGRSVMARGGLFVPVTEMPRQARVIGRLAVVGAVEHGRVVPCADNWNFAGAPGGGRMGLAVTGFGPTAAKIPPGTTGSLNPGTGSVVLSTEVTLAPGDILCLGVLTVAGPSDGTKVTVTTPPPFTSRFFTATVNGTPIAGMVAARTGSKVLTLSSPHPFAGGERIALGTLDHQDVTSRETRTMLLQSMATAGLPVLDAYGLLQDPADPHWFAPATSFDGIHANDFGNTLLADAALALLRPWLR